MIQKRYIKNPILILQLTFKRLQPKILFFTFGAAFLPVLVLSGFVSQLVRQPLVELEKSRLEDQVLAFRGYTAATEKGIVSVTSSYAIWTDLFEAVQKRDRTWIKREVTDQLVFSTNNNIDTVQVMDRQGTILGEHNPILRLPPVKKRIAELVAARQPVQALMDTGDGRLLLLSVAPIYQTDGKGTPPGSLILGRTLDQRWLKEFLGFSQPSNQLQVTSLSGQLMSASDTQMPLTSLLAQSPQVLATVKQGQPVYQVELSSDFDTVFAPLLEENQVVAAVTIRIRSDALTQALNVFQRQIWLGLGCAVLLSIAIAHHLARQIADPINRLSDRSKTLAAGDLKTPIPGVGTGGELGQLADAYSDMAQALQILIDNLEQRVADRTAELEQTRRTLEQRVVERTEELWQNHQQLQQAHDQMQQLNTELAAQTRQLEEAMAHLQQTQAQLIQTEKMSSLGQMVAGIAHEINNPMGFIYGNLAYTRRYMDNLFHLIQLYQDECPQPSQKVLDYLDEIDLEFLAEDLPKVLTSMKYGAERIHQIILSLRIFSRLDESELKTVDIHEGLESTLLLLQNRLSEKASKLTIQIIKDYGALPLVECYAGQLNQVFMHLLNNAIDALAQSVLDHPSKMRPRQNIITIKTEMVDEYTIAIQITDNGVGMTDEVKARLFDPFFTTKPIGRGTGLGLSVSYQVVKKHGGQIDCLSEVGQGAQFSIRIPIRQTQPVQMQRTAVERLPRWRLYASKSLANKHLMAQSYRVADPKD